MHSATKYLGGHSDIMMGTVSCSDPAVMAKVVDVQNRRGAVPGIQDCYLMSRSIWTLEVRKYSR